MLIVIQLCSFSTTLVAMTSLFATFDTNRCIKKKSFFCYGLSLKTFGLLQVCYPCQVSAMEPTAFNCMGRATTLIAPSSTATTPRKHTSAPILSSSSSSSSYIHYTYWEINTTFATINTLSLIHHNIRLNPYNIRFTIVNHGDRYPYL